MKKRKLMALGLAGLMMVSSAMPVFAVDSTSAPASGTVAGSGDIEGTVEKDVFTVTLPTTADINFSIDPQELKLAVDSTYKVDGSAATAGYGKKVLFTDASKTVTKSPDITVVNKSTFDVDVKIDTKVTGLKTDDYEIALVEDVTAASVTGPAISLVLTDSTNTLTDTTEGTDTKVSDKKLTAADSFTYKVAKATNVGDAYKVTGDKTNGYQYGLDANAAKTVAFNELVLNVSGAVKDNADWSVFDDAATKSLKIEVAYTVEKHVDKKAPDVSTTEINHSAASGSTITYDLGVGDLAATKVATVTWCGTKNGTYQAMPAGTVTDDKNGKITLTKDTFAGAKAGDKRFLKITFDDTAKTSVIVTLTKTA